MYDLTQEDKEIISSIMNAKAGASMSNLDSLIMKTERTPKHDVLYRGVCNTELRKLSTMGLGDVLEINRPMSFTPSIVCAEHFTSEVYHTDAIIQINADKPCMNYYELAIDYVNALPEDHFTEESNSRLDYYVMLADEMEHIYKSGTVFQLSHIEDTDEGIKIYHFNVL